MSQTSKKRKRLYGFLAIILIHLIVFSVLEGSLRLLNIGVNPALIQTKVVDGDTYLFFNKIFSYQYFGAENTPVPEPNTEFFKAEKDDNTFRIFIVGESTSRGFPYSKTQSFPRQLEQMLNAVSKDMKVEVMNFSIDATNAHIGVDVVKELVNYPPDLAIVYYGHNEFIGIGGAGQSKHPVYRLNKFCYRFRTYQLIKSMVLKRKKESGASLLEKMAGKQGIDLNSELFTETLNDFEHYYAEMLELLKEKGISTITCGVAKNLRDFPPLNAASPTQDELAELVKHKDSEHDFVDALNNICSSGRNIAHGVGEVMLEKGFLHRANICFELACDYDAMRLRAPSYINRAIESLSDEFNSEYINLQSVLNEGDTLGIAGNNLFLEHVHPTLNAHTLIAKSLTNRIAPAMGNIDTTIDLSRIRFNATIIDDVALCKILYNLYTQYPLVEYAYFNSVGFESIYKPNASAVEGLEFRNQSFKQYYNYLGKYFEKYDKTYKIHFKVGVDYFNKKDYNRAYQEFAITYDQNPLHMGALNNMALIRYIGNDKHTTGDMFDRITQINEGYSIGLLNYWLYAKKENKRNTQKALEKRMKKMGVKYSDVREFIVDDLSE